MREENDPGPVPDKVVEGGKRPVETRPIGNSALIVQRHIVVDTDDYEPAREGVRSKVSEGFLGHQGRKIQKPPESAIAPEGIRAAADPLRSAVQRNPDRTIKLRLDRTGSNVRGRGATISNV